MSAGVVDGLTEAQREAATADGAVLVLAGAGTGKTKCLTAAVGRRISEGVHPNRILAVTFTNKAANEMGERVALVASLPQKPMWMGTFHGICARILRQRPELAHLRHGFDILDGDDSRKVLKRALKSLDMEADRDSLNGMSKAIEAFKDWLVPPEESAARTHEVIDEMKAIGLKPPTAAMTWASDVYVRYQQLLREANAADFSDLLMWPTLSMERNETVRKALAGRWDVIMADEYQDVNNSQYRFLRLLGRDHRQVFVVGDDDQAIYGFRFSNVAYIRRFQEDFPEARMVRLEENFRSTELILNAANAVIAGDSNRLGKTLYTNKGEGHSVECVVTDNADEEAWQVASEIERRVGAGANWSDVAVLYRSNYLSRTFETQLARRKIPYTVVGDVGFWERQEVKDALALVRLADMPDEIQSDEAFRRVANVPPRGIGEKKMVEIEREAREQGVSMLYATERMNFGPKTREALNSFRAILHDVGTRNYSLSEMIHELVEATGYTDMWRKSKADNSDDRLENIAELERVAADWDSIEDLLDHAALAGREGSDDGRGKVKLMSLHRAKGLEFPHVFLVGWEEGIFPSERAIWDNAEDEERRLAYVGITRAQERLAITSAMFRPGRSSGGSSRFIADIPDEMKNQGWLRV